MKRSVLTVAILVFSLGLAAPAAADCVVTTNAGDTSPGSLGACIAQANLNAGVPDVITFNVPTGVGGAVIIQPVQEYLFTDPGTTVDGTSQPGSVVNSNPPPQGLNTVLKISIDGSTIVGGVAVFHIETTDTVLKGLNIHSGPVVDVMIGPGPLRHRNTIQGCFIGTDVTGTIARPSGWLAFNPPSCVGVLITHGAQDCIIGIDGDGLDDNAERNLISGELRSSSDFLSGFGVLIDGSLFAPSSNLIAGNLIGTTVGADDRLANGYGIGMINGSSLNTVAGNVISGNGVFGIWAEHIMNMGGTANNQNRIYGNFIGINPNIDAALSNGLDGIHMGRGCNNFEVGRTGFTLANVVSGNGRYGIWISGDRAEDSSGNLLLYNIIGMDTSGAFAVPNGGPNAGGGIYMSGTLGGNTIGDDSGYNLISGNLGTGIFLMDTDNNSIQGNVIGLNMAEDTSMPNSGDGISMRCTDISCCQDNFVLENRVARNQGNGIALYGLHEGNTIGDDNTVEGNAGAGIQCYLPDDSNSVQNNSVLGNTGHGIELIGSSVLLDTNAIYDNGGWGITNYPSYGGDQSPAGAGNDTVGLPAIYTNDIDGNLGGGIVSLDSEPFNGSSLHLDNSIGDNNSEPDVLQLWFGAVEIIDSGSPPPVTAGGYTVTLTDAQMISQSGSVQNGGLWGDTGFLSTMVTTWFTLVAYTVDTDGSYYDHNPHTVVVTGPTGGTVDYSFDGVDNDTDTCNTGGCSPAGILTGGQFRYQVAEVFTQTDSDGDGTPDTTDCAPFDAAFQGVGGGVPCDADSDGYCDDTITGGVSPTACPNETMCTMVLCTPTDCMDMNAGVNPGATEGPTGDPTCSDSLDNDCDSLTDMSDPSCPQCLTNADCDDANDCTNEVCTAGMCMYTVLPDGSGCDDGLYCTDPDVCTSGVCDGGVRICPDDQCNTGSCNETLNQCDLTPIADGTTCNDTFYCTDGDTCLSGACIGGPMRDCSSLDGQCTLGVCDDVDDACEAIPDNEGNPCDDGMYCTVSETCTAGNCTGGVARDCSAFDDQCNTGACDEAGDACYADPAAKNGVACDDGDACTMSDTCSSGTCAGVPLDSDGDTYVSDACGGNDCDDSNSAINPGVAEICDDTIDNDCDGDTDGDDSGCAACTTDDDCDDGNACNGVETCVASACVGGTPLDCDDSNVCTTDSCDAAAGCQYANNTLACDDGDACTMNDACSGGTCSGVPLDFDGDGYVSDACAGGDDCDDAESAIHPNAAEICDDGIDNDCDGDTDSADSTCAACTVDGDCDDSNVCNGAETCLGGFCQPGTPLTCDDGDVCTDDSCDAAAGCQYSDNTLPCDDGDACTMNDACASGTCAGEPLDADGDGYVSDACAGGNDCDDGNGAIHPNAAEICDDSIDNDCDGDTDAADSGCAPCAVDADCDDANACNGVETCVANMCQPGTPPDCDDSNPCTDDSCDTVNGCQNINNTDACDDSDACTVNDTCAAGVCSGDPLDADNDGFQPPSCGGSDCDDNNAAVNPDADEICDDSIDNDCNGDTDGDDIACQGCPDADGDGFASDTCGGTDCDDTNDTINPDAMEMCSDGVDNDCNGDTDLDDDTCKRPAAGCDCTTQGGTSPALLLSLLGLLILRRRKK